MIYFDYEDDGLNILDNNQIFTILEILWCNMLTILFAMLSSILVVILGNDTEAIWKSEVSPRLALVIVTTNDSPKCKCKLPLSDNDEIFVLTLIIFGNACETCLVDR